MFPNKQFFVILLLGVFVGFITAYMFLLSNRVVIRLGDPHSSEELQSVSGPVIDPGDHNKDEEFHKIENKTLAEFLYRKVRILCWIMTGPENHENKARHVKATWGKRCNKLIFMSSEKGTERTTRTPLNKIYISFCLLR